MSGSTEIQKWADSAMYRAEPLKAEDGPRVYLLWMTPDPLGAVAAMAKMYKGEVVRDMARDITDDERIEYFEQIMKTKLQAPLEAVQLHFMVEGVTRSFTHQMVRQRTAVYAQESLRFAVKEDMAEGVALPPSLFGTKTSKELWPLEGVTRDPNYDDLSEAQKNRLDWDYCVSVIASTYKRMIDRGMPAEDARGLLPHNITTRLNYVTDLRALLDHGGNRLCTQAQFEWRLVWVKLIEAIRSYRPPYYVSGGVVSNDSQAWQFERLAGIFRPVCYLTGKCEFKANFDRKCKIRDRVEANHQHGRSSEYWDQPLMREDEMGWRCLPVVDAIHPREWLMDASAAR